MGRFSPFNSFIYTEQIIFNSKIVKFCIKNDSIFCNMNYNVFQRMEQSNDTKKNELNHNGR